jgi:hypothetical protein
MTESYDGRRPHDPNDIRGGGGPAGPPDSWDTSNPKWGPLRDGEPQVIYPPGHPRHPSNQSANEPEGAAPQPAEPMEPAPEGEQRF